VALNVEQYGSGYPGPQCFKSITIQYGGKTAQATIMDEVRSYASFRVPLKMLTLPPVRPVYGMPLGWPGLFPRPVRLLRRRERRCTLWLMVVRRQQWWKWRPDHIDLDTLHYHMGSASYNLYPRLHSADDFKYPGLYSSHDLEYPSLYPSFHDVDHFFHPFPFFHFPDQL
jgi:hypothetical protein